MNSARQTTQNTATQNYHGFVASYNTTAGNEMGLLYTTLLLSQYGQTKLNCNQLHSMPTAIYTQKSR